MSQQDLAPKLTSVDSAPTPAAQPSPEPGAVPKTALEEPAREAGVAETAPENTDTEAEAGPVAYTGIVMDLVPNILNHIKIDIPTHIAENQLIVNLLNSQTIPYALGILDRSEQYLPSSKDLIREALIKAANTPAQQTTPDEPSDAIAPTDSVAVPTTTPEELITKTVLTNDTLTADTEHAGFVTSLIPDIETLLQQREGDLDTNSINNPMVIEFLEAKTLDEALEKLGSIRAYLTGETYIEILNKLNPTLRTTPPTPVPATLTVPAVPVTPVQQAPDQAPKAPTGQATSPHATEKVAGIKKDTEGEGKDLRTIEQILEDLKKPNPEREARLKRLKEVKAQIAGLQLKIAEAEAPKFKEMAEKMKKIEADRKTRPLLYYAASKITNPTFYTTMKGKDADLTSKETQGLDIDQNHVALWFNLSDKADRRPGLGLGQNEGIIRFNLLGFSIVVKNAEKVLGDDGETINQKLLDSVGVFKIIGPDGTILEDNVKGYSEANSACDKYIEPYKKQIIDEYHAQSTT